MENEMKPAVKNTSKYVCKHKRRSSRIQNLQSPELVPIESLPKLLSTSEFIKEKELFDPAVEERFDCNNGEELLELTNHKAKIIKERKYFKRNNENSPKRSNQTEDDSKVYKISKAIPVSPDSKLHLKTYTNPRRYSEKIDTVESFGLPDNPLTFNISSNVLLPQVDQILDTEILDAKEITIQDLRFVEEPWCIIDLEQTFCELTEIRIKTEPQSHANNDKSVPHTKISKLKKTSPNKRKLPIANHSLNLEEHEVEIFNSSTFRNLSSIKTNNNYSERRKLRSNTNQELEEILIKHKANDFVPKRVLRSNSCTDLYELTSFNNTKKIKKSKSQTDIYSDNKNINLKKKSITEKSKKNSKNRNQSQHLKVILSPLKVAKTSHHLDINEDKIVSPSPTFSEIYLDTFQEKIHPKSVINNTNICTEYTNIKSNKNGFLLDNNLRKHYPSEPKLFDLKSLISNLNANEGRKSKIIANQKLSKCFSPRSYAKKSLNFDVSPQEKTSEVPSKNILLPDKKITCKKNNKTIEIVETIKIVEENGAEASLDINTPIIEQKELVIGSMKEENKENNEIIEISVKPTGDTYIDENNMKETDVSLITEDLLKNIINKQTEIENSQITDNKEVKTPINQKLIENTINMDYETTILLESNKNLEDILDEEVSSINNSVYIETKKNHIENKNKRPKTRINGQITDLILSPKLTDKDEYPIVTRSKTSLGGKKYSIIEECISPNKKDRYLEAESPIIGKISRRKSTMDFEESNCDKITGNDSQLENNTDEIINNYFNENLDDTNISFKFNRFNEISKTFNNDNPKQNIIEPNYSEQENINNKLINIDSPSTDFNAVHIENSLLISDEESPENTFLSNNYIKELENVQKPERGRFRSKSVASIRRSSSNSTKEQFIENDNFLVSRRKTETPNKLNIVKRSHSVEPKQKFFKKIFSTFKIQSPAFMFKPKLGKIAWAQIGNFPYWPCIITKEPITEIFQKTVIKKFVPGIFYHVRFFGDKGRRAWIFSKKLMEYSTRDDLKNIYNDLKQVKSIADLYAFCVKDKLLKKWTTAVEEVEYIKSNKYNLKQVNKFLDKTVETPKKSRDSVKIKTEETTELNQLAENNKKKKKNNVKDSPNITLKKEYDDSFSNEADHLTTEQESIKIEQVTIKDEITDIEYITSVDSLNNFGSYSLEEQRSLFKRNSLFKGIPKDKVCQFCFNFSDIYKCKGGCNGIYHLKCAMQVLVDKVPKRRKISLIPEKIGKRDPSTSGSQSEIDENHVQIITVPSSVCGTPPRKTFPPDCMNMTLAERIDFKMKEIMKKFESTTYLEMLSECGSDEKPSNSPLFKNKSFSRCQDLFSASSQNLSGECSLLDKELDAISRMDYQSPKQIEESLERILKPSLMKHITADSPAESNDNQNFMGHITADSEVFEDSNLELKTKNKKLKNRKSSFTENKKGTPLPVETKLFNGAKKSLTRHITADSECTEILDSESLRSNSSRQSKQSEISEHLDPYKNFNPKHFKCGFCTEDIDPYCFICHDSVSRKGSNIRQKCSLYQCSRFYHPECLKLWPQTQWSLIQTTKNRFSQEEIDSFVCPQHVCHTCVSDDPRASIARCSGDKIVKCLCCPTSYHSTNLCVPAGSEIITSSQIVCPRHRNKSKNHTINTTWCLLCNQGGNLICCENCPTSVHPECMTVNLTDDDKFICEDCESGRLPLYDEIVWVKVGQYKWWPGLILFPNEVPLKVFNAKHSPGDFVVKFFGTYDYYWVNRGRSFLFQEGDTIDTGLRAKNKVVAVFKKAVEEAVIAHKMKKQFKSTQTAETASSLKPPPYIKIKVSKPVGNVKLMELDLSNITACECDPSQPNPCGPDSNCLNRILWTECNPEVCPAGTMCNNQSFEKREYPPLVPYKTETRGWGLKALALIKKGQFVIEYVGELIDDEEYQRRIQKMQEQKEDNYYFLTIHTNRMIDAGPKGNVARFMNHCCQPNCETQKWTVNGETRVGLFATEDILAHSELTFNYNLECTGTEKKVCKCGAAMCSGFIGVKVKQEITEPKKPKKSYIKRKEPIKEVVLPPCFICEKKGDVGLCNNKICNKAYHLKCLNLEEWPEGKKFVCRWHYCNLCSKRTIRCCVKCLDSFCPSHSEGNIRYDNLMGFVCKIHEPSSSTIPIPIKKKRGNVTSEDAIVTSTTDDNEDDVPLDIRKKIKKSKKENLNANPENETVSSDEIRQKRKRKPKRKMQNKRIKLNVNKEITANINNGSNITK